MSAHGDLERVNGLFRAGAAAEAAGDRQAAVSYYTTLLEIAKGRHAPG